MAAATFQINLSNTTQGGNAPGGGSPPPWALNPQNNRQLTPGYVGSQVYQAQQAGFMAQAKYGLQQAFAGGSMGALQKQAGLVGMGSAGAALGNVSASSAGFGPVGLALAAANEGAKMLTSGIDTMRNNVKTAGEVTSDLVGNRFLGAFSKGVEGAASSMEKIPILGQVYGASLRLAGEAVSTFTHVVNSFVDRGELLGRFNGQVAESRAISGVRSTLGDIREAEVLGAGTARLTDAQSRFNDELREILLPIKRFVVNVLAGLMEKIASAAEIVGPGMAKTIEILTALMKAVDIAMHNLTSPASAAAKIINLISETNDNIKAMGQKKNIDAPLQSFFQMMALANGPQMPGANGDAAMMDMMQKMNQPGLKRP